jgi:hypothetical protein
MLALRDPLPNKSDWAMTIGQIGLFLGIVVAITIRIKSNAEFIGSVFAEKIHGAQARSLVKFACVLGPLFIALLVEKEVLGLISTFSSLLCPYFIIIIPGLLNLKLSKQLKLGKGSRLFIWVFMISVSLLLFASVIFNIYAHIQN